ncbi:hypothetical protein LEP1GSC170_0310 [Leptospira interrogans serovar Bataviae str. HAI135]|nr:hypothetical protein LEP1GSC170_0310 [Leptospira interrogans serovar Bataviae str. HAI135]
MFFRFASKVAFSLPPKNSKIPCDYQVLGNPLRKNDSKDVS